MGELIVAPRASIAELFERHYASLVRLAVHLVDDPASAEDVVQDVFAALDPSRSLEDPKRYLTTAVVNRCRSTLRRRRVARLFVSRAVLEEFEEPASESALRSAERARMLAAIDGLPRRQREAVVLRYYEDLPVSEIALVLDTSPGAVSSALTRALDALKPVLGGRDD